MTKLHGVSEITAMRAMMSFLENDGDGIGISTVVSGTRRATSKAVPGTRQLQEDEVAVMARWSFLLIAGH